MMSSQKDPKGNLGFMIHSIVFHLGELTVSELRWVPLGLNFWVSFSCDKSTWGAAAGGFYESGSSAGWNDPNSVHCRTLWGHLGDLFLEWISSDWGTSEVLKFQPAIFRGFGLMIWSPSLDGLLMVGFFRIEEGVILSHSSDFPMFSRIFLV